MEHLKQPRGPGTAYQFRMRTPPELRGRADPETGRPFGGEIVRGLGTDHLPTAKKLRDETLGRVRAAVRMAGGAAGRAAGGDLGPAQAEAWAAAIAAQERHSEPEAVDVRGVFDDMMEVEEAEARRQKKPERVKAVERMRDRVLRRGPRVGPALEEFLAARAEGNRSGYKALAQTTVNDTRTAAKLLAEFMETPAEDLLMADVTAEQAHRFRVEWLPGRKTKRAPLGLSVKTIGKHATLLNGLWGWAIETKKIKGPSPWRVEDRLVPRAKKRKGDEGRDMYSPEEAAKLLAGLPRGSRLGDLFRLALVTGCRVDEIAKVARADLVRDARGNATGFTIQKAKTAAGVRFIPVPEVAQAILEREPEGAEGQRPGRAGQTMQAAAIRREARAGRLFPEFPIRAASGKAAAASQAFTRERRAILGEETDGRLSMHSARHTWRTVARRAGVAEDVIHEIGGWTGEKKTSSVYDHGMARGQLSEAQEGIAGALRAGGWLKGW